MAGKKKEVSLQVSINNDEQWGQMLATNGLTVVDVYQRWCGPCRAVVSLFRKIKNELGDDLLHFAIAEADSIEALEKYRGKCEPTFLFCAGGELVAVLRGANAPLLQRMVVEELAKEKRVLEQGVERRVVKDDGLTEAEEEEEEDVEGHQNNEDVLVPADRPYTVAIIKPDVVAHGKTNEIILKIQDAGFEILAHEERTLSVSEAEEFYQHRAQEPYFEDLVRFMSGGPSHVLVLSKPEGCDDVTQAWREFLGPVDIEEAKRECPESLRAQYGTETLFNALHGSSDTEQASRELAFFFPSSRPAGSGRRPGLTGPELEPVERTLALVRPDAARENREEILARIHEAGFTVAMQKEVMLTEEQVCRFYTHLQHETYFPALLANMTSGPVLALALAKQSAVQHWRDLLGPQDPTRAKQEQPTCLRAQFAGESESVNPLHGSRSVEEAEQEINFFFPKEHTLAVIKPDTAEEHRGDPGEIQARHFAITRLQETVLSRELAEEFYKEHGDKPFFSQLVDYMCRGPCMMLILTKEDAVEEWRTMMGPSDPSEAREMAPGSLRARFAKDILENTVHGSSSAHHAQEKIHLIFGDISSESEIISTEGDESCPLEADESFAELRNLQTSRSPSFSDLRNQTEPSREEVGSSIHLDPETTESQTVSPGLNMDSSEQQEAQEMDSVHNEDQTPTSALQDQFSDS